MTSQRKHLHLLTAGLPGRNSSRILIYMYGYVETAGRESNKALEESPEVRIVIEDF